MCFSPEISFTSGAVITAIGAATLKAGSSGRDKLLITIPLIFGVQQITEGFVWLQLAKNGTVGGTTAVLAFLGFALVIWPVFVPLAVLRAEEVFWRRKVLKLIAALGIAVGLSAAWLLITASPEAYIEGHSVGYRFKSWVRVMPPNFEFLSYITPSLFPFFFSSKSWVRNTGTLIFFGMLLAMIVKREAVTSVWCFFAAVVSTYIAWYMYSQKHLFDKKLAVS